MQVGWVVVIDGIANWYPRELKRVAIKHKKIRLKESSTCVMYRGFQDGRRLFSIRDRRRNKLIDAIKADDPNRPGSAIIIEGMLIGWHTSGNAESPYDFHVFIEGFQGNRLQQWQADLMDAPYAYHLGSRSSYSLYGVWACGYHRPITDSERQALIKHFGVYA